MTGVTKLPTVKIHNICAVGNEKWKTWQGKRNIS